MKISIRKCIIVSALIYMVCPLVKGQIAIQSLTYTQYMDKVNAGNLEYAAQKLNVSISEAEAIAANVRNDPQLGFNYFNNEQAKKKMGYGGSVSISQTVTFGKRTANVELARSESALSKALLGRLLAQPEGQTAQFLILRLETRSAIYKVKVMHTRIFMNWLNRDSIPSFKGKIMGDRCYSEPNWKQGDECYNELLAVRNQRMKMPLASLSNIYPNKRIYAPCFVRMHRLHLPRHRFLDLSDLDKARNRFPIGHYSRHAEYRCGKPCN